MRHWTMEIQSASLSDWHMESKFEEVLLNSAPARYAWDLLRDWPELDRVKAMVIVLASLLEEKNIKETP